MAAGSSLAKSESSAKTEYIKELKALIKDTDKTPLLAKTGSLTAVSKILYEIYSQGVRGKLKKDEVISCLAEISGLHPDLPSMILDVACILDSETSLSNAPEERNNFSYIVKESEKFLSDKLLKERLEIDSLLNIGILKNDTFSKKFIKIKTKLYYKQRRFNLFREESEGYAKLLIELNQEITGKSAHIKILEVIKSLIGCFNLDPNRVLDVILEAFECRPTLEDLFIPLIKSYMGNASIIRELLGFKFTLQAEETATSHTPEGLYLITALLIQHSIIKLDDIYPWLKPDDSVIWKECEKEMKEAQEYARKLSLICTNKQDDDKEQKETPQEKAHTIVETHNQKLQLGAALLQVGCWEGFNSLAGRLPDYKASSHLPVAKALCRMLHATIDPLYKKYCPIAPKIKTKPVPPLTNSLAVPQATKYEDLREIVIPALAVLGPSLHIDPILMYKVVRLLKASRSLPGDFMRQDVLSVLDSAVLPALSYMDGNCCMAEEVYTLLKLYPYQFRYCLYARWKNDAPLRHVQLLRRRADAQRQIKAIMKRISKENVKPQGRLIGKLSHAAPGFFFDYVILQIQIYDNLIGPVVESLKYLTSLSYDMLGYCLVEALGGGKRARVQLDGSSAAPWLQGLAAFCGAACKKYSIDLTALLQFVANQLKAQKSLDLLILKEIVQKMAGIEAAEEWTPEQLDAMSGGELLRGEAGYFSQVRNTKKSSQRLKEALISGGEGLDASLCMLAAQQRYCCAYEAGGAEGAPRPHLKLVGRLIDQCQDALVQFGAFLAVTLTHDEYCTRIPPIEAMLQEYHIGADVAFFLARPALGWSINARYDKLRHDRSAGTTKEKYAEAALAAMQPIVTAVSTVLPPKVWEDISPSFYVTFWSLTLYDLHVPEDSYKREINRLTALVNSGSDGSSGGASKGRKEQEKYNTLIDKLKDELKKQQEHVSRVRYRLQKEKDSWFPWKSVKSAKNEAITQFMQLCLFPRCIFTAMDALYCSQFLQIIHSLQTENFSTLLCYDRLFCDITYTVTCLTEGEAGRYGRFLRGVLGSAMRWHADEKDFQKECANSPCFLTKFRVSNQFREASDHVGYENYRHVCHKWHYKITKAMVVCLDSGDYVQIRNSLIVLIHILPHFPVLVKLSQIIEKKVERVRDEEKTQRQDLYILATSYSGQLRSRASQMMNESDFHQTPAEGKAASASSNQSAKDNPAANGEQRNEKESKKESSSTKEKKSSNKSEENSVRESKREASQSERSRSSVNVEKRGSSNTEWEERRSGGGSKNSSRGTDEERRNKDRTPTERPPSDRSYRDDSRYLEAVTPPSNDRMSEEISLSSTNNNGSHRGHLLQETQDRGYVHYYSEKETKRRKLDDSSSLKGASKEIREISPPVERRTRGGGGTVNRSSSSKTTRATEDREARKERKLGRKRVSEEFIMERTEEPLIIDQKRRRDEQKAGHQNGEPDEHHSAEKHHHKREKSPYRERSHERESREKQRVADKMRR